MKLPELNLFQRNFASIVITPTRILAIKLNGKKNKVEVFGQKNIPPGVIMSYRVRQQDQLVEVITSLWKEIKLKDKFVGVVVPEFATYTKTLTLPNLTDTEINEALNWQIQEYLPAPVEDVIIDWKIIDRKPDQAKVQVVAILKDMLMGYIDAVGKAGLSPLVVETQSLSMVRLTIGQASGKLVIYLTNPEALLVVAVDDQIVASSVVSSENLNIVVSTALQMINHYSEVTVEKVLVSGSGVTKDLISNLHYNLGRNIQYLDYKMNGLAPAQVQDYLLAISLQHKDPVEPASDKTINLLPPHWAESYRKKLFILKTWTLTLIVSVIAWATFLSAFLVMMAISFRVDEFSRRVQQNGQLEFNQAVSEVRAVNAQADKIINIGSRIKSFQEVMNSVYSIKPDGISISNLSVNMETGTVNIIGIASTRDQLIQFKNAIDENENLGTVEIPLTSLILETNINFDFTTQYKPLVTPKKQNIKLNI